MDALVAAYGVIVPGFSYPESAYLQKTAKVHPTSINKGCRSQTDIRELYPHHSPKR